jgi:putative heme-binding domain-containing protein
MFPRVKFPFVASFCLLGATVTVAPVRGAEASRLPALTRLVQDDSPKVRVEALRALAKIPTAEAAAAALSALEKPMDPTLDYALWLTINDLAEPWIAALQSGAWKPEGREKQLEFALKALKPEQASRVLGQVLASRPLAKDGAGPWIEVIGAAGSPAQLRQLFDQTLNGGFDEAASARAIRSLADATRLRKVKPEGDTAALGRLLDSKSSAVLVEALKLAAVWKDLGGAFAKLGDLAGAPGSAAEVRDAAFTALRQIGGAGAVDALVKLSGADREAGVRRQALGILAALDLGKAMPAIIEAAKTTTDENSAVEFWRAVLTAKGAGKQIAEALPEQGISPAAAKAGLRVAREGGRSELDLVVALAKSAGLAADTAAASADLIKEIAAKAGLRVAREGGRSELDLVVALAKSAGLAADTAAASADLIKEIAAKAVAKGDPNRGEWIYRRQDLACVGCHAIGGAGGKVGPDMTSIGASAPIDYLVEAVLLPNVKIKEGYHSVIVTTKDETELTGTLARETGQEVVLRDAAGKEVAIAKADIAKREQGTLSLMPGGLLDPLNEQEQLDLFAFLSRLGKPGDFDAAQGGVARRWQFAQTFHTDAQSGQELWPVNAKPDDRRWRTALALVKGLVTRQVIGQALQAEGWSSRHGVFAATEVTAAKAGTARFKLVAGPGTELWVDGKRAGGAGETSVELTAGVHRLVVRLDPKQMPESLRLESKDVQFVLN